MNNTHTRISPGFPSCLFSAGRPLRIAFLGSVLGLLGVASALGVPSGGPYGPIQQRYDTPEGAGQVHYVSPEGQAESMGEGFEHPTTLEAAIERVRTGDVIVLRGGIYRTGDLKLNQGVTMQPYADEQPVLKGTRVATEWEPLQNGLWRISWPTLFPDAPQSWWRRHRHGKETPLYLFNNDMVFIDGEPLRPVGWEGEIDESSYFVNYDDGEVYIGTDPAGRTVEITAFDNAMTRVIAEVHGKPSDGRGPVIRGIAFTQYAYRAIEIEGKDPDGVSNETDHGKDVVGTTIEHCSFTHCSRVAGYFRGDGLTIRHCLVSDTGTEGIFILSSSDVLLEKNIIARNNMENITGYFASAVKIFNQCYRVTCRDNLVMDHPNSSGIWYDVGNVDGVFVDNWIMRSQDGFFFEISKGAICAGNVFVDCMRGIHVLNSSNVQIYQNTLINSEVSIHRTPRSAVGDHFGWHPATGPDVNERDGHVFVNNLLVADREYRTPLFQVQQSPTLCGQLDRPQVNELDYNVYVRRGPVDGRDLILWSPAANERCRLDFPGLADLQAHQSAFSAHSREFSNYGGPLFQGQELGRYRLLPAFPAATAAAPLPAHIADLLGLTDQDPSVPGAFPLAP